MRIILLIGLFNINSIYAAEIYSDAHRLSWNNQVYSHANTANYINNSTYNVGHINYNQPNQERDQEVLNYTNYNNFNR